MVLESTIICCDNSNYQRNGDYIPTRLCAQTEAINLISLSKIRSHPENNVALMTIANTVEVLTTLTSDIGRIAMKMGKVTPSGDINLITGLRIAHLVLKHRQEKHFRMRIVAFVGSPLPSNIADDLVALGKRFRKEKVQVDIISYGGHDGNEAPLVQFIEALNGKDGDGSHIVDIPRGMEIMELLVHSPIVVGEDVNDPSGLTSTYEYGVDPNVDPDLALALRISAEEERQRQIELRRAQENDMSKNAPTEQRTQTANDFDNMTEEEQIAYTLRMSMNQEENVAAKTGDNLRTEPSGSADGANSENSATCCSHSSRKSKDKDKSKEKEKDKKKKNKE